LKKRSLEDARVDQPRKRVRTNASRTRNLGNSRASSIGVITEIAQQATRTISSFETASSSFYEGMQSDGQLSQFGRSGRTIRLPTRFR
jgi:hypothetical protein